MDNAYRYKADVGNSYQAWFAVAGLWAVLCDERRGVEAACSVQIGAEPWKWILATIKK